MKTSVFFFIFLAVHLIAWGQSKTINIKSQKGDIIAKGGTKNVNYLTTNNNFIQVSSKEVKEKVLLVNKYIDTSKPIEIKFGGNSSYQTLQKLRAGWSPVMFGNDKSMLAIKLERRKLQISTRLHDIDGKYLAQLKNNTLHVPNIELVNSGENYVEIIDEYYVPIMQIDLDKRNNAITLKGVFFANDRVVIISDFGFNSFKIRKPFELMTQNEKDYTRRQIRDYAKQLLPPLHDDTIAK
jgi:hypothetical protein